MSRKMASIQRIWKVEKHPNADALDIVNVMGWKCVAKIGEFQPQDFCVYIEIVDPKFYNDNLEYRFDDATLKHFNLETQSEREKRFNICSKHERFKEVLEIYDKWVEVNIIDVMKNMEKRV